MFKNGSVITLAHDKMHGEGEDALKLKSGVCGMVVQLRKKSSDGNHEYVVDFGAYGQWYCYHREITGDETEGWDQDEQEAPRQRNSEEGLALNFDNIFRNARPGELRPIFTEEAPDDDGEEHMPVDPVQADIDRRIKELERGMK